MAQALSKISVTLRLSQEARAKLTERAAATGKPLAEYISTLVESVVEAPRTLAEISGPVYQRFVESGTTDQTLSEELEKAKHDMRNERRGRQAS
ncbi:MAG TPA: hypothetical protein VHY37_04190 [Tepidisphaeraceae bacterium]|nr:hypothetical protein [Tepidisphaeraceae bacterium]